MKYAIVIPDGAADEPQETLGGQTPLQAARTPHMDRIAARGVVGLAENVPPGLTPASDVATLSLFGYDPLEVYTGRAPLEAAAMGVRLGPNDWAVRCNLVYVADGRMRDFTAGHISSAEARQLIDALQQQLGGQEAGGGVIEFHPGVQYRHLLVWRGRQPRSELAQTRTQPPHDIPDQPIADNLPQGPAAEWLIRLMDQSRAVLADHPVNRQRLADGKKPATQIWLWGQGQSPRLTPFAERFGKRGAIISAVDLVRGVGVLLGWQRIDVPGATGYLDTNYANKGKYAVEALAEFDLVCVHVEAPDEASHEGRVEEKIRAIEQIDEHIVGPLLEALPSYGDYRILVEPDHRTTLRTRAHARGPVPFALCGRDILSDAATCYDEIQAAQTGRCFDPGHRLMLWLLGSPSEEATTRSF